MFKKHVLSTRHWQGCSDMIPIECFGDSSSSMFWSCSVAGKGVFSNKIPLLRAGNIIEAPPKGSGSLGSVLSYSLSPASLPVQPATHPQSCPPANPCILVCSFCGPTLLRTLQSPLATFCLETSLHETEFVRYFFYLPSPAFCDAMLSV